MSDNETMARLFVALADVCGKKLNETAMEIYMNELTPLGIDRVNKALKKFFLLNKWPSVVDIQKELGCSPVEPLSTEEIARNDLTVLMEAARKDGWNNPQRAKERVGEKIWAYVQACGGWVTFLEGIEGDNQPAIQAQLRESLKAYKHKEARQQYESLSGNILDLIEPRDVAKALKSTQ